MYAKYWNQKSGDCESSMVITISTLANLDQDYTNAILTLYQVQVKKQSKIEYSQIKSGLRAIFSPIHNPYFHHKKESEK